MFMCDGIKPLATLIQKKRSANQNAQNSTYLYFFYFCLPAGTPPPNSVFATPGFCVLFQFFSATPGDIWKSRSV